MNIHFQNVITRIDLEKHSESADLHQAYCASDPVQQCSPIFILYTQSIVE